jgi:hypothetical protein
MVAYMGAIVNAPAAVSEQHNAMLAHIALQ